MNRKEKNLSPFTSSGGLLYWGIVLPHDDRDRILGFLRGEYAAAQLCALPYQTWSLDTGECCLGIALQGMPTLATTFVALAERVRSVPAAFAPDDTLQQARQTFQALQQIACDFGIPLSEGELLCVVAAESEDDPCNITGAVIAPLENPTLVDCLYALDGQGVSLLAVQVPETWGLALPYWTPHQLIEVLDERLPMGWPQQILESYADAPSHLVLVRDVAAGIFAEIHCICGGADGCIVTLPVVFLLTHTGVRDWMSQQQDAFEQDVEQCIEDWRLDTFCLREQQEGQVV
jgi:hypothetical protein